LYDKNFPLDEEIRSNLGGNFGDIVLTFEHPLNYHLLPSGKFKIGFLVYEFTRLPDCWVKNINEHLNLVFVPSRFSYEVFLISGVRREKVKILRYGFNPSHYYPAARRNGGKVLFFCVSSAHKRESLYETLSAFGMAFSRKDSVKLLIKLSYMPQKFKKFEDARLKKINELTGADFPETQIISDRLLEREMGDLYRRSDFYFSLCGAESFGLPFLEAIACGRPVISVNYGGQKDFLTDNNAFFVKYKIAETAGHEYEKTDCRQSFAYADLAHAAEILRAVKEERQMKNPVLKPSFEYFHWRAIAADFLKILSRRGTRCLRNTKQGSYKMLY